VLLPHLALSNCSRTVLLHLPFCSSGPGFCLSFCATLSFCNGVLEMQEVIARLRCKSPPILRARPTCPRPTQAVLRLLQANVEYPAEVAQQPEVRSPPFHLNVYLTDERQKLQLAAWHAWVWCTSNGGLPVVTTQE